MAILVADVINIEKTTIGDAVLIDETTIWGNVAHIGHDEPQTKRHEILVNYIDHFWKSSLPTMLYTLIDKKLACRCVPKLCHGDFLLREVTQLKYVNKLRPGITPLSLKNLLDTIDNKPKIKVYYLENDIPIVRQAKAEVIETNRIAELRFSYYEDGEKHWKQISMCHILSLFVI